MLVVVKIWHHSLKGWLRLSNTPYNIETMPLYRVRYTACLLITCMPQWWPCVQVPFGSSFHNLVRWCAWTEPSSGKTRLQVSCDVIFTARWVPAKGIINSSSIEVRALQACFLTPRHGVSVHVAVSYGNSAECLTQEALSAVVSLALDKYTQSADCSLPHMCLCLFVRLCSLLHERSQLTHLHPAQESAL